MKKPFIIGIAGGSASGKSTFAGRLQEALDAYSLLLLPMDSYFKSPEQRAMAQAPITGKTYRDDNHPSSFDLARLKQDLAQALQEETYQVVIIEGLLTLWDAELCAQLDLRLFVECRPDERIVRRLRRNMTWGLSFDEIANVYLDMVRYRHDEYVEPTKWRADLILNGSAPSDTSLAMIAGYVQQRLSEELADGT